MMRIVSGGLLFVIGVGLAALALPSFRRYDSHAIDKGESIGRHTGDQQGCIPSAIKPMCMSEPPYA